MVAIVDTDHEVSEPKEYQTLFWVPMLFQTAKNTEALLEEMLDLIQDFHDQSLKENISVRKSILRRPGGPKRRQQIWGEALDSEAAAIQRVDVVMKSESTKFALLSVLKRHFLFSQLRDFELDDVIDVMQAQYANEGDLIIEQGDSGELFYVLEEGTCEIVIDNQSLGSIETGSSFGDLALMYNCPRAATIKATTDCTLWTLDRIFFRQAMVTSSSHQNVTLSQFLSKINQFSGLNTQQLNQLARSLTKQSYDDHQYIIRQGDIGDQFYVIYKGNVIVSKTDDSGKENVLIELGEGEVFGERALIKKEPRKANVVANGPVEVYYLESHDFYSMLGQIVEQFNKMNEFRIIRSARLFARLSDHRLRELTALFTYHRMFHSQRLVCGTGEIFLVLDGQYQTTEGGKFSSEGNQVEIGNLEHTADEVAGAITILSDEGILISFPKELLIEYLLKQEEDEQRNKANTTNTNTAGANGNNMHRNSSMLHRPSHHSHSTNNDAHDANNNNTGTNNRQQDAEKEIFVLSERRRESAFKRKQTLGQYSCTSFQDVLVLQPLGKGTFGSVFLCELKPKSIPTTHTNTTPHSKRMALKCLSKSAIVSNNQTNYIRREILALSSFQHPFVVEYYGYFTSYSKICLSMEYITGGELWSYLYQYLPHQRATGGDLPVCKVGEYGGIPLQHVILYAANIILALEHVHTLGYCYRDLKPENLMISLTGFLKLVDFGFAKQVPYIHQKTRDIQFRTYTLCGTPDYMSP